MSVIRCLQFLGEFLDELVTVVQPHCKGVHGMLQDLDLHVHTCRHGGCGCGFRRQSIEERVVIAAAYNYSMCVHVYVCVYMCMYVCTCVCMCVHVYVCVHMCAHVCTWVCMCAHVYACVYMCMYVCTCVCMCVHVYVCVYMCMYVCTCVCMCVHGYVCVYMCVHVCAHVYVHMYVCMKMISRVAKKTMRAEIAASSEQHNITFCLSHKHSHPNHPCCMYRHMYMSCALTYVYMVIIL